MELNKVLGKVRGLVAVAEDPGTDPAVAQAYREKADELMLRYAIEEAALDATRPAPERAKPDVITVAGGPSSDMIGYVSLMAQYVATHCRCKIRLYTGVSDGQWQHKVYGYESDLRYFEVMFTTLQLHMLGVLAPGVDKTLTVEENTYRLHSAGYNWLTIAGMYGWRRTGRVEGDTQEIMYRHRDTGERKSNWALGSFFKSACFRACRARGEEMQRIAASGTKTYRRSAASGYATRIRQRLAEVASSRQTGAEVVLASRATDLESYFRQENPDLFGEKAEPVSTRKIRARKFAPVPHDDRAYRLGVAHANAADLGTGSKVGPTAVRPLGR